MGFISQLFGYPLGFVMWLLYAVVKNYGIALLLFTLVTRALLFPFSIKQQKNMAKTALLQPKLQKLQKQYGKNKQKYQEEMMKLYEQEGYNPMSGCLPLLIQFPILFGLIDVVYKPLTHIMHVSGDLITKATEIAKGLSGFNASSPEISIVRAINNPDLVGNFAPLGQDFIQKVQNFDLSFFGIDLGVVPQFAWSVLIIIPILSGITSLCASLISTKLNPSGQQATGMMKGMMLIMPLFSLWFAFQVPTGVSLYWTYSNIFMAVQTVILYKIYTPERMEQIALKEKEKQKAKGKVKKPSRMQQMLAAQSGQAPAKEEPQLSAEELKRQKEINRQRLAEARRKAAEKYGEEYVEDDSSDTE